MDETLKLDGNFLMNTFDSKAVITDIENPTLMKKDENLNSSICPG